MSEEFYDDGEDGDPVAENEIRECGNSCAHFDSINQCCWIFSERGLCSDVREGDTCLYGFTENDER